MLRNHSANSFQYNSAYALCPKQNNVLDVVNLPPFLSVIGRKEKAPNAPQAEYRRNGSLTSVEASLTKARFMNDDILLTQYDCYRIWAACIVKAESGLYREETRAVLLNDDGELAEVYHCQFPDENCYACISTELLSLYHSEPVSFVKVSLTGIVFGAIQHKAFQIADGLLKKRKLSITLIRHTSHLRFKNTSGLKARSKRGQYLELNHVWWMNAC